MKNTNRTVICQESSPRAGGKLNRKDLERTTYLSDGELADRTGLSLRTIRRLRMKSNG